MHTVGVIEAKDNLASLLETVEAGGEVVITREGKPVARLSPAGPSLDQAKAMKAANGLSALSKGLTLGGLSIKDLVSEGHR